MRFKIVPPFLKRLDHFLLLHYRLLWVSKLHYVLSFCALMFLLGSALIYTYPLTTASAIPDMNTVLWISCLLVAPACLYWVYWQTVYGIEKQYGLRFRFIAYLRFALYLLCFSAFGVLPLAFTHMVNEKIAKLTTLEELVADVNALNIGNFYMPTNTYNDTLWHDTRIVEIVKPHGIYDEQTDSTYYFPNSFDTTKYFVSGVDTLGREYYYYNFSYFDILDGYSYAHEEDLPTEFLKWNKDTKELFFQGQSPAFMLEAIKSYIKIYNKYSKTKIKNTPEELLKSYLAKKVLLSDKIGMGKSLVKDQITTFHRFYTNDSFLNIYLENRIEQYEIEMFFTASVFVASLLLFVFQYVSRIDLGIGLVVLLMSAFMTSFIAGFLESGINEMYRDNLVTNSQVSSILLGITFFSLLFIALKNYYLSNGYTKKRSILLVSTAFISFVVLLLVGFAIKDWYVASLIDSLGLNQGSNYIEDITKALLQEQKCLEIERYYSNLFFYSSHLLYFIVFVPLFHALFVRLRALPKVA